MQRERPNERFLQGTLRSIAYGMRYAQAEGTLLSSCCLCTALTATVAPANRRVQEEQMWAHRDRVRRRPQGDALQQMDAK